MITDARFKLQIDSASTNNREGHKIR